MDTEHPDANPISEDNGAQAARSFLKRFIEAFQLRPPRKWELRDVMEVVDHPERMEGVLERLSELPEKETEREASE